jgi:hypothetical protein
VSHKTKGECRAVYCSDPVKYLMMCSTIVKSSEQWMRLFWNICDISYMFKSDCLTCNSGNKVCK